MVEGCLSFAVVLKVVYHLHSALVFAYSVMLISFCLLALIPSTWATWVMKGVKLEPCQLAIEDVVPSPFTIQKNAKDPSHHLKNPIISLGFSKWFNMALFHAREESNCPTFLEPGLAPHNVRI